MSYLLPCRRFCGPNIFSKRGEVENVFDSSARNLTLSCVHTVDGVSVVVSDGVLARSV